MRVRIPLGAQGEDVMRDAGCSTCPVCKKKWLVTVFEDCIIPACGCFGSMDNTGPENPNRPCEACGLAHAFSCGKMNHNKRKKEVKLNMPKKKILN